MPLLWKKVKGTKISQLFSDHLESQRRQRGHLVVETGFPTSLVDLFVKNRDRLKKPNSSSKKKKKKKKKKDQIIDDNSSLVFPSPSPSPSPSSSPLIPRAPCSSPAVFNLGISSSPLPPPAVEVVDGGFKETDERPNAKGVLGALLWTFFVVVIALWTKRFAVGLTMSALLLFFVEFIGKKTYRFLVPCSGVKRRLRLLIQSIFQVITISFLIKRNESFDEKFNEEKGEEEEQKLGSHGNPNCEIIQIASEPMLMVDGCIQEPPLTPLYISEPKKKGKRAKMKSKIKRLFKGSSSSKKAKRNPLETEEIIVPILEEDEEEEEEKDPNQSEQKSISRTSTSTVKSSSSSSLTSITTTTQDDEISTICITEEENLDGIVTGEEEIEWRKKRKMVIITIIMCIIVLVGLTIGGKFLAMGLVVFWFLMLKSREILRRYIHTYEKQTHID